MIDPIKAAGWAKSDDEGSKWKSLLYIIYRRIPKFLQLNVTIPGIFFGVLNILSLVGLSALPFFVDYLTGPKFSLSQLCTISGVIVLLMSYCWAYSRIKDYLGTGEKRRSSARKLALMEFRTNDMLMGPISLKATSANASHIETISRDILICIEQKARIILKEYDADYLQVTLLLFNNSSGSAIKIAQRANPTRSIGKIVPSSESIAYFVARAKKPKVLNDLKRPKVFPYQGLSGKKAPYRSILFIPLLFNEQNPSTSEICKGVVTIDSSRPYEFWGDSEDLITQTMPYIGLLKILLKSHPHGISV